LGSNNRESVNPPEEIGESGEIRGDIVVGAARLGGKIDYPLAGSLALDIETYCKIEGGKSKATRSARGALDPHESDIRLVSLADPEGHIELFDLKDAPLSDEVMAALGRAQLIIHNAAFELRFLGAKFGLIPENVFCTMTASRLLDPSKMISHDLGSAVGRHLSEYVPKELGASDWGGNLSDAQRRYALRDVFYLHRLRDHLSQELDKAGLLKVFELEIKLLSIVARMELFGFSINAEGAITEFCG
jgi:DNA polymerase I-like protein with 3'-5' exonuclease and polymerase domains